MGQHQPEYSAKTDLGRRPLLIRADASTLIGSGHVMRCLALAQAWKDRESGEVTFLAHESLPAPLYERLQSEGMDVRLTLAEPGSENDATQTIQLGCEIGAAHVIVDGYVFGADYQKRIKDAGVRLLFIDDNGHADYYSADLVLNQNIHASEILYTKRAAYTQLLLGTSYVLLRHEFWKWRAHKHRVTENAQRILVTMGGSDPDNVTLTVVEALLQIADPTLEVRVMVGSGNPHRHVFDALDLTTNFHIEVNVSDIPAIMDWADLAISAGGSTQWELAFMGVPTIGICIAENQRQALELLKQQELICYVEAISQVRADQIAIAVQNMRRVTAIRARMVEKAQQLIDGLGTIRVLNSLCQEW